MLRLARPLMLLAIRALPSRPGERRLIYPQTQADVVSRHIYDALANLDMRVTSIPGGVSVSPTGRLVGAERTY